MKKTIILLLITTLLAACSNKPKQLRAPCTYENRTGCGQEVPLQQGFI